MNELDACRWLEKQTGLKLLVGKDRKITLTDGMSVEISGVGILGAVVNLTRTLQELEDNGT